LCNYCVQAIGIFLVWSGFSVNTGLEKYFSSLLTEEEWGNVHLPVILFLVASSIVIFMAVLLAGCVCVPAKIFEAADGVVETVMKKILLTAAVVCWVKMKGFTPTYSYSMP